MKKVFNPFHFVLIALAGWMNHRQYPLIDICLRRTVCCESSWLNVAFDSTMISDDDWPSEPNLWGSA
jgi:hypothetical protein